MFYTPGQNIGKAKNKNSGPVAVYNSELEIQFDNKKTSDQKINAIPPYGEIETNIDIPYSFLGQKVPSKVELLIAGEKKSEFSTYKTYVTISNLLMLCLFIFLIVFLVYLKFRDAKKRN